MKVKIVEKDVLNPLAEIEAIKLIKPAGAPATPQQLENAVQADLSILALGDCGSCTSWVILDAIRLEKDEIPTISICSHKFITYAKELARSHGMENLRIVEIEHPIAGQSQDRVERKVKKILPEIEALLKLDQKI
jgi:hypothetical protein